MLRTDIPYVGPSGNLTQAGWAALVGEFRAVQDRLAVAEAKIAAAAAVANAAGGGTIDTQARAQLAAIKVALT